LDHDKFGRGGEVGHLKTRIQFIFIYFSYYYCFLPSKLVLAGFVSGVLLNGLLLWQVLTFNPNDDPSSSLKNMAPSSVV
jgi:hypothetical protein